MRRETTIKGASFTGTSDLTIVAPIRKGFVPALDAVTYKTRVKRVLKALHLGRQTAHEYDFARVMSDAVERVGRIHSIRIAIIESENRESPEDKVVLAVTFDGSWESYIRVIWQKVSRSLDLIFCNTEGYVTGWGNSFDAWCVWLRAHHAEAPFLYSTPGLSYQDTQYLRMFERRHRVVVDPNDPEELDKADLATTRIHIPSAEEISDQLVETGTDPMNMGLDQTVDAETNGRQAFRQGMRSLAGLYGLLPWHFNAADGAILHRAACELLREFVPMIGKDMGTQYQEAIDFARPRFADAMNWLNTEPALKLDRPVPALPIAPDESAFDDVQGGIIRGYPDVSHGCLLLLGFDTAADLGAFLSKVQPTSARTRIEDGDITVNIALTLQGVRLAGLSDDEISALPEEFVQGMERRAGTLGDLRANHPRRWRLPALNAAQGIDATDASENDPCPRVDLGAVHLVLQLRLCNKAAPSEPEARTRLLQKYVRLGGKPAEGVSPPRLLSIQWMHHLLENGNGREHFGFLDSQSQPVFSQSEAGKERYPNQIHLGEILLGHDNAADTAPRPADMSDLQRLLRNGSFLVIRKLRQDIEILEQTLSVAARDTLSAGATSKEIEERRLLLLGKMVGRWPIGHPEAGRALAEASQGNDNDFSFEFDEMGARCPFHAHIRRANPREIPRNTNPLAPPGARPARLIRRGMSYGPLYDQKEPDQATREKCLSAERGLVFMAYNASIGEQFEVIQRWLSGGNSSGSYSGQSDPLLGVAEPGRPRYFRFEHDDGRSMRIALDGSVRAHDEPRPIVRLEWGMYLFTPSLSALQSLAARATISGRTFAKSWSVERGEQAIARLREIERSQGHDTAFVEWKAAIEDPDSATDFGAASIWAAIRERHGGVLQTPIGVLVASRELVDEVLLDGDRNLTATGYLARMQNSFGQLYLGLDAGQLDGVYERESVPVNAAIMDLVGTQQAFDDAVAQAATATHCALARLRDPAIVQSTANGETRWEVTFEAREIIDEVLAHFCETWFGLDEKKDRDLLRRSGTRWNWVEGEPPCYPGHFMAPSRYTFQPHPGPEVEAVGSGHGVALRLSICRYLARFDDEITAKVARAVLDCDAAKNDPTYPARTLAGVLMGFLPTTDGNIRRVLNEWLNDGTLWALRAKYAMTDPADADAQHALTNELRRKFRAAMQLRAAPELLWRTAARGHTIGKPGMHAVAVRPGEIVVASLISATHDCMERGDDSLHYAFGGNREDKRHPTHACPGYGPATAVMFGFFRGLVESDLALRPGPAALTLVMDGYLKSSGSDTPASTVPPSARSSVYEPRRPARLLAVTSGGMAAAIPAPVRLLTIGDSWLYFDTAPEHKRKPSLTTELGRMGYVFENRFCKRGWTLEAMAEQGNLNEIGRYLRASQNSDRAPRGVVVGGGGIDLVGAAILGPTFTRLYDMLVKNATSAQSALDRTKVGQFIGHELKGYYVEILKTVTDNTAVPVFLHAYDDPIPVPDNGKFRWLGPIFEARQIPLSVGKEVMQELIRDLNKMLEDFVTMFPGRIHTLKLNGTLAKEPDFGIDFRKYWGNELHATDIGFRILANVAKIELATAGVT